MQIELWIDKEKKVFTAPIVPMLAKRKFFELQAREEKMGTPTIEESIELDDAMYSILSEVVFKGQFTLDQLYEGAETEYAQEKIREAVFGKEQKKKEGNEGNEKGE